MDLPAKGVCPLAVDVIAQVESHYKVQGPTKCSDKNNDGQGSFRSISIVEIHYKHKEPFPLRQHLRYRFHVQSFYKAKKVCCKAQKGTEPAYNGNQWPLREYQ
jgi:hypothetical protein